MNTILPRYTAFKSLALGALLSMGLSGVLATGVAASGLATIASGPPTIASPIAPHPDILLPARTHADSSSGKVTWAALTTVTSSKGVQLYAGFFADNETGQPEAEFVLGKGSIPAYEATGQGAFERQGWVVKPLSASQLSWSSTNGTASLSTGTTDSPLLTANVTFKSTSTCAKNSFTWQRVGGISGTMTINANHNWGTVRVTKWPAVTGQPDVLGTGEYPSFSCPPKTSGTPRCDAFEGFSFQQSVLSFEAGDLLMGGKVTDALSLSSFSQIANGKGPKLAHYSDFFGTEPPVTFAKGKGFGAGTSGAPFSGSVSLGVTGQGSKSDFGSCMVGKVKKEQYSTSWYQGSLASSTLMVTASYDGSKLRVDGSKPVTGLFDYVDSYS